MLKTLALLSALALTSAAAPIEELGYFSNLKATEDHQYGVALELWRSEGKVLGLFTRAEGEAQTVRLRDLSYDPKTGRVAFKTRMDSFVYAFMGKLTKKGLKGKLTTLEPGRFEEKVTLPRAKEERPKYRTLEEWETVFK